MQAMKAMHALIAFESLAGSPAPRLARGPMAKDASPAVTDDSTGPDGTTEA